MSSSSFFVECILEFLKIKLTYDVVAHPVKEREKDIVDKGTRGRNDGGLKRWQTFSFR